MSLQWAPGPKATDINEIFELLGEIFGKTTG